MEDKREAQIGFNARRTEQTGSALKISLSLVGSTLERITSNELPILLNALRRSTLADASQHVGFTYVFPFSLAQGRGFPYVFPFALRREASLLKLK